MDYRSHAINLNWTAEEKLELFRQMVRIRRFEQKALLYYQASQMAGWLFLSIGQELVAAGVRSIMRENDHSISGNRGLGHALAAGMEMGPCMAEFFGKTNGASKGKAGAFSFYAPQHHHWGCHGIAAAHTPIAAGLAFGLKQQEIKGAVFCFLGEGSVNQGVYHESLNLAGLFNLPVVYVIENNGYAMGTSLRRSSAFRDFLARRAEAYDIEWDALSDDDPYELRARVHQAAERARNQQRPTVLEISTYRYHGFTIADPNHQKYRTSEEINAHKARDPIRLWLLHLESEGIASASLLEKISLDAKSEAQVAVKFAQSGEFPLVSEIQQDVYWESDHQTDASKFGRHFFE